MKRNINETAQVMTYEEREILKGIASDGECLPECITMIAHFMRQYKKISFSVYASNWLEAEKRKNIEPLKKYFPFSGKRLIADNCSDIGTYDEIKTVAHK